MAQSQRQIYQPPTTSGPKYEYHVHYAGTVSRHDPSFVDQMNQLGDQGWLLSSSDGDYLYFVREKLS